MKKVKKKVELCGKLMCPVSVGKIAIFTANGQIFHTSRVVALHEQDDEYVHFETANAHYHLSIRPFLLAAICPLPVSLAACA